MINPSVTAIAVNPVTNELYVAEGSHVAWYDSTGNLINSFEALGAASYGLAVNGTSEVDGHVGELYVSDHSTDQVDAFKTVPETHPLVNDRAPVVSAITRSSGRVGATIDPGGLDTTYHIAYVEEANYDPTGEDPYEKGQTTQPTEIGSGASDLTLASQAVAGLLPDTTYHYAIVASNLLGTVRGPDYAFTTAAPTPPAVVTGGANGISQNAATLSGTVNTEGLVTTYGFEVATDTDYGPPTGLGAVGAGVNEAMVTLGLAGLQPGETYHYRIVASSVDGTTYGADQTFTTPTFPNAFVTPPAPLPFVGVPAVAFPGEIKTTVKKIKKKTKVKSKKSKKKSKKKPKAKKPKKNK